MESTAAPSIERQVPGLTDLWAQSLGDPRICIAILDGPVDLTHPSLAGAALTEINLDEVCDSGSSTNSDHGTHVASIIFGNHQGPVKGVAPNCRGLIIPIFRYAADGSLESCSQQRLAKAIRIAARFGANVINVSAGQFSSSGEAGPELRAAIEECGKDVLIVAAAGNDGCDCLHVPGALPSVLAVGAMNSSGQPLPFSNWGEAYRAQGVLAPGERVVGASSDGGVTTQSGTSFATPIVSGVAGLLLSLQQKLGIVTSSSAVRSAILQTTHGCDPQTETLCERVLAGRLNLRGCLSVVTRGTNIMQNATSNPAPADVGSPQPAASQLLTSPTVGAVQAAAAPGDAVDASACCGGCAGGSNQFVYAIGELHYDFPSVLRERSVQQNMERIEAKPGHTPHARNSMDFLRHLNGYKEVWLTDMNIGDIDSIEVKAVVYQLVILGDSGNFRLQLTRPSAHDRKNVPESIDIPKTATAEAIRSAILNIPGYSKADIQVIANHLPESANPDQGSSTEKAKEFSIEVSRGSIEGTLSIAPDSTGALLFEVGQLRVVVSDGAMSKDDVGRQVGFNGVSVGTGESTRPSVLNSAMKMIVRQVHAQDTNSGQQVVYVESDVDDGNVELNMNEAHYYVPSKCRITTEHRSNMYDASATIWKLNRGEMEVYGIVPDGNFSEAAYQELAEFYMNQCGVTHAGLNYYYYEKAGRMLEWEFGWDPCFNDPSACIHTNLTQDDNATHGQPLIQDRSERVAIPGVLQGEVQLLTGVRLPAIKPDMRGTAEWSQSRMLDILVSAVRHTSNFDVSEKDQKVVRRKIRSILERLDNSVRNPGLAPEHRALNHAATRLFGVLGEVAGELLTNDEASVGRAAKTYELDDIVVNRSEIGYAGSDCWDVEVSFFNPENQQEALVVVAQTIDVNDTIPALTDKPRKFRRR